LLRLKGIGVNSAWLYVMEFFAWRGFRNRREVGALAGLTPTPYQSGESSKECGISKAGNRPVRGMAIEIAWGLAALPARERLEPLVQPALCRRQQPGEADRDRCAGAKMLIGIVEVSGDRRGAGRSISKKRLIYFQLWCTFPLV